MATVPQATISVVKNHLRAKDIKLWRPPYTDTDGRETVVLTRLAAELCKELEIPEDVITVCLRDLRQHTIERLRQNENFKKNKLASLKIKCTKQKQEFEIVETRLDIEGQELKRIVAERLKIAEDIKLICAGRVIQSEVQLSHQGVNHNSVILCLVLSKSSLAESSGAEEALKAVDRARKGAELLAAMGTDSSHLSGNYDVQIADQKGQSLDLPEEEKRSLTVALGLHEKGRAMVKRKNYEVGLLLLLEADKEFRECRAEILSMVDNYAVLCLDIVWCYVCTKNIAALPDAKVRLNGCEDAFKKSYGDSLQRLLAIKGSSGNEISLFVRLYLLQGIVLYHEEQYAEAKQLLDKAQGYARNVVTDENKVTEMMKLGFAAREARRALRANLMDVSMATQWAFREREEHKEIKKQEKEKKRIKSIQKNLGPCANGDPVNIDTYDQLVTQMGFEPALVGEALKQASNDVGGAIEMIDKHPDLLRQAAKDNFKKKGKKSAMETLKSMGFNEVNARACLDHFSGAVEESAAYLAEHIGQIPGHWIKQMEEMTGASSSNQLTAEEEALVRDVAHDVTEHDDEYLDITLEEEMELITQYLTMVASVMER